MLGSGALATVEKVDFGGRLSWRAEVLAMRSEQRGDGDDAPHGGPPPDAEHKRIMEVLAVAAKGVDAQQVPAALCRACVELLPVTGVSLTPSSDWPVHVLLCASDRTAARLSEAQYTLGDGPCRTAVGLTAPVLAGDLTEGSDNRRWPIFAHQAVELGVRAVFSLPLGTGMLAVGTLDLYRDTTGALSERDLQIALMLRDAIT